MPYKPPMNKIRPIHVIKVILYGKLEKLETLDREINKPNIIQRKKTNSKPFQFIAIISIENSVVYLSFIPLCVWYFVSKIILSK